jgi:hypothetical protein
VPGGDSRSSYGQVLWAASAAGTRNAAEIWRFTPGSTAPERLLASPHADAVIDDVVAAKPGYAFVERSRQAYGAGGWRIWFLPAAGGAPVELDRGSAPGAGTSPTIAIDDTWIAWAAFDEPRSGAVSRLRIVSIDDLAQVTMLIDAPIADRLLWFPALAGDELWYASIHPDFKATGVGDEFHLEWLMLSDLDAPPTRFPGIGNDFDPAVNDRFIVWKTTEAGDAALNWGTVHVLDRRTDALATIPVPDANRPSIGDRYVTFDEISHRRLSVFDPVTQELFDLLPAAQRGQVMVGGESLSGRLLTFTTQGLGYPQIGWALLPE